LLSAAIDWAVRTDSRAVRGTIRWSNPAILDWSRMWSHVTIVTGAEGDAEAVIISACELPP
jgi:hypothetical protein